MYHSLSWFTSREAQTIYRNNKPVIIQNKRDANYYHGLQEEGFQFTEDTKSSRPAVHVGGGTCISCEG